MLNLPDHTEAIEYSYALSQLSAACEMFIRERELYGDNPRDPLRRRSLEYTIGLIDATRAKVRAWRMP